MIRARSLPILIAAVLLVLSTGCDSQQQQDEFVASASRSPEGFVRTDETGAIIDEDEDDWRTAPVFLGKIRFDPPYPNPISGDFLTLPVTVLEFDAIQGGLVLRARDASGQLRLLDEVTDASSPGAYIFRFSPVILARTGLVRIFVFDRLGELITYGDVQING